MHDLLKPIDKECFKKSIEDFYNMNTENPFHRFRSWEHCYLAFKNYFDSRNDFDNNIEDYLTLHLSFYLASWGMYRGSTELLKHDYKFNKDFVKILCNEELSTSLYNVDPRDFRKKEIREAFDNLIKRIQDGYNKYNKNFPSQTLISKILLGVLGCCPAYDRYVISVLTGSKITPKLSSKSIWEISQYLDNGGIYEIIDNSKGTFVLTDNKNISYPIMKIIDMAFWQYGFNNKNKTKEIKYKKSV